MKILPLLIRSLRAKHGNLVLTFRRVIDRCSALPGLLVATYQSPPLRGPSLPKRVTQFFILDRFCRRARLTWSWSIRRKEFAQEFVVIHTSVVGGLVKKTPISPYAKGGMVGKQNGLSPAAYRTQSSVFT